MSINSKNNTYPLGVTILKLKIEKDYYKESCFVEFCDEKIRKYKKIIDNGKIWNYNLGTFFSIIFNINF